MKPSRNLRLEFLSSDRGILFDERSQKIYGFEPHLAYLWVCLEEGAGRTELVRELASRSDLSLDSATHFVDSALAEWKRCGFFDREEPLAEMPNPLHGLKAYSAFDPAVQRYGRLAGTPFVINYESENLASCVHAVFEHVEIPPEEPCFTIWVPEARDGVFDIGVEGCSYECCRSREALVPTVKASVAFGLLARGSFSLGVHAAAVESHGRAILLPGESGAGKSTFTLGLCHQGFSYLGDDTVFLDTKNNNVRGLAFCAGVKSSAWHVVGKMYPQLLDLPVHRRSDDKLVRYLHPQPESTAFHESFPVHKIVIPRWRKNAETRISRLDKLAVLKALVTESYSPLRHLTGEDFTTLVRWLYEIDCYHLIYSDMDEAVHVVKALCD